MIIFKVVVKLAKKLASIWLIVVMFKQKPRLLAIKQSLSQLISKAIAKVAS